MALGIVRASDRDAIWREAMSGDDDDDIAADEEFYAKKPTTSAPPTGAPKPPAGQDVVIPNSNKFKTPANGLKNLLSAQMQSPELAESHKADIAAWLTKPQSQTFAKTYFKPGYAPALKAHLGEDAYNHLVKHLPPEHVTALSTEVQQPAPKSNKFKTPANGLKKLLESPETQTGHVKAWMDDHPGFAKTYMGPGYADALKGHLGEKNYAELQKHLQAPAPPTEQTQKIKNQPYPSDAELDAAGITPEMGNAGQEVKPPPGVGTQHPALAAGIKKVFPNAEVEGKTDVELKGMLDTWLKYLPDHEGFTNHVPKLQALQDQFFGGKGPGPSAPSPEQPPEPSGSLQDQIKGLVPGHIKGDWYATKSLDDQKQILKQWIDHPDTSAYSLTPEQQGGLQKLYDQHFGEPEPADLGYGDEAYTPAVDMSALSKDMNSMGLGSVPEGFDAEKTKNYLQNWAGAATGASLKKKLQQVLDTHFGDGGSDADEISKIKQEGGQPAFDQWHTPKFLKWMASEYGLQPGQVNDIAKASGPGGKYENAGGIKSYFDEFQKGDYAKPAFEDDFKKVFPDADPFTTNSLTGKSPEEQKKYLQDLIPQYSEGGDWHDEEQLSKLKRLINKHFGGDDAEEIDKIKAEQPKQGLGDKLQAIDSGFSAPNWNSYAEKNKDNPEKVKDFLQDLINKKSDPAKAKALQKMFDEHFGGDTSVDQAQQAIGGDPWGSDAKGMTPKSYADVDQEEGDQPSFDAWDLANGLGAVMDIDPDSIQQSGKKFKDKTPDEAKKDLQELIDMYGPDYGTGTGGKTTLQDIYDKHFGGGSQQPTKPTGSLGDALNGINTGHGTLLGSAWDKWPKDQQLMKLDEHLKKVKADGNTEVADELQKIKDQYFPGVPEDTDTDDWEQSLLSQPVKPAQPTSWEPSPEQIEQLKQDMIDNGTSNKDDTFDWLTGMDANSWKTNLDIVGKDPESYPPDSPWGKLYQQMLQQQQGGSPAPTGGPHLDKPQLLQDLADVWHVSTANPFVQEVAQVVDKHPELAKSKIQDKLNGWAGESGKGSVVTALQAILDKHFGSGAPTAAQPYDPDAAYADWKNIFAGDVEGGTAHDAIMKGPEAAKKYAEGVAGGSWKGYKGKEIKQWVDKHLGGAPAAAPVEPWNWSDFGAQFKSLYPGSGWATDDIHTYEDAKDKLKGAVQNADANYPGTEKTQQAHDLYTKYFGDMASTDAAYAKGQAGAEAELQGLKSKGDYPSPEWVQQHFHVTWSPEEIKKSFDLNPTGTLTKSWANDEYGDKDQYSTATPAAPAIPEEPEEDEGVSAPFKDTPAKDEDVAAWMGTKPETPGQWKDFAKWWGATQLSPEQESAIYSSWFPNKLVAPEKANAWFQKVFEYHSKPGAGDLESGATPSWAHNSWAFGDKADKEWPVFQAWASKHPGIPQGSSIKQKVAIWKSLSGGDKKAIAADYLPEHPVDTNAAVAALQTAYPDSDWTNWAKMGQGTLAANVETLAKAGYDGAIPVYNQFFGGDVPMPKKTKKTDDAPKTAPQLKIIPESKLPPWVAEKWGTGLKYAKDYTELKHWADSVGQSELAKKGPVGYGSSDPHYQLRQLWNKTPVYLKAQINQMKAFPWKDEAGFKAWVAAQPTLKDELTPIVGADKMNYSIWNYGGATNYWSNKQQSLGNWIDQEVDPQKKQQLLGIYHKYFGAGKETLSQGLKSVYPDQDWDKVLKTKTPDEITVQVKKAMKAEKDPEKFVHLVDLWNKYFIKPGTTNAANSGIGVVTKTLNKYVQGDTLSATDLKALHYWKTHDGKSGVVPDYWNIPDDYKSAYASAKAEGTDTGGYPAYHGWTPPGDAATGSFTADPAMLASSTPSYTAPEQVKGKQYQGLLDKMDKNKSLYGQEDRAVASSEQFAGWFASNSTPYKEAFQHNPGVALDDYKAFMAGNVEDESVPEGEDGKKVFDVSPFANVLPKGKKGPGGKALPVSQTFNQQRDESIKFPQYQDEQETLPLPGGQQWAPHYAPMPIYRLIKFPIDQQPTVPPSMSGLPLKQRELFLEQQRERLRRIDEILHGTPKVRNTDDDYKHLMNWGSKNKIPEDQMKEVADQLFSSQPALSSDERWKHFEDFAKTHSISAKEMYQLANQLGVGNPGQGLDPAGSYDHPELGQLLLDYIENGGNSNGDGMGIHWTRDIDKLYNGISAAGIGAGEMKGQEGYTPILLSGYWGGQGEGGGEGGAYSAMDNREREHNLRPGAPVQLRRVQIRDPKGDFHDLMDYGPVSLWHPGRDETASGKKVFDKPSLAQHLQQALGSKFDKDDWDWMTPGHQADIAFNKLVGKYPDKIEEIRKIYKRFFVGRPDLPTKPHIRRASLAYFPPPAPAVKLADLEEAIEVLATQMMENPWHTDLGGRGTDYDSLEEVENQRGEYPGDDYGAQPRSYKTPMFTDTDRPELPKGPLGAEYRHYFSPHEVNPPSGSGARPNVDFDAAPTEQPTLPGMDPTDRAPVPLYRGMMLDLNHPDLGHLRRALGVETGPQMKPHEQGYDDRTLGSHILDHIQNNPNTYGPSNTAYGIGPHWTSSRSKASIFAGTPGDPTRLPVILKADWKGAGEDPYRNNTMGYYPDEKELTMLPGANMNISGVQIMHPKTKKWHDVLDAPSQRQAAPVVERKRAGILTVSERYL